MADPLSWTWVILVNDIHKKDVDSMLGRQFTSILPGDGLMEDLTVYDVMDTTGETLCYIYE